jgi:phospho-N-acetylmuramoyl-pentapeptide-transferase
MHEYHAIFNVFKYLTFRAALAFLITFIFVLVFQPIYIRKIRQFGGQPIREDGPKEHFAKKGTPTMGGVVMIAGIVVAGLLLCDLSNLYVWLTLGVLLSYSVLGFFDDWKKITKQDTKGVSGKGKLFWQSLIAAVATGILVHSGFSTELYFPFFKEVKPELGYFFIAFAMVVLVGTSNAVNLTDGLDGLAIGPIMTVAATYGLFSYLTGHRELAEYLGIFYVQGVGEVCVLLAAIIAGGLGFLWYNTFPAQVFMGDIGALALGGTLGFVAVLVKQEIVLVVAGGIFVIEALSVIIQRYSYKLRNGKRVFRMAPIHHHFELLGWPEPKIIVRFWIISIVLALLTLTTLKLR